MGIKTSAVAALVGVPPGAQVVQLPFSVAPSGFTVLSTGLDPGTPATNKWFTVKLEVCFAQPADGTVAQYVKVTFFYWNSELTLVGTNEVLWMDPTAFGVSWVTIDWSAGFPDLTVNNPSLTTAEGFVIVTMSPVQGPTADNFPPPK